MRNGTIKVKLSYPVKFGFIAFWIKKEIGFSFNQRAMFNILENNKIDLPNHSEWLKNTPKGVVVLETLFAGAQSYREGLRLKDNFSKKGLLSALTEADKSTMDSIVKCWQDSEQLGYKRLPGKKKAKKH
jgi:hypothetical protein